MITSRQNPKIKNIRLLNSQGKARKKQAAFVIEGIRIVEEALRSGQTLEMLIYTPDLDERGLELVNLFKARGIFCEDVTPEVLSAASDTESPQGILAVVAHNPPTLPVSPSFLLIADQIRDPGNLGTLMRTALAAGADGLILSQGTVDPLSPKVVRAGMGAHFRLPYLSTSWPEIRQLCSGLSVFLADMNQGNCLWESDLVQPLVLVIGGEAHGSGNQARQLADQQIHIPMHGGTESLNAAAAGAILLFEVDRQRRFPPNIRSIVSK